MRTILAAVALVASAAVAQAAEGWVVLDSSHDVSTTADRLETIIDNSPATLVARIDHQANAESAGLELAPATVLIFGNPQVGTPIMRAAPEAAFDLPIRVLVWEDEGQTRVGYLSPEALQERYDISGADEALNAMANALETITGKAVQAE